MAYSFTENHLGFLPLASTDAGITPPNQSTKIPTPPTTLGMIARAVDPTYGEGEFILLVGVASTAIGNLVTYNATTFQTTLAAATAGTGAPVAVAMSACTAALFGWYQISGYANILKDAGWNPQVAVFASSTAGKITSVVTSGKMYEGMVSANLATVASSNSAPTTVAVMMNRPHMQGLGYV